MTNQTNESDTPETDEQQANLLGCCQPKTHLEGMADFARKLERERNASRLEAQEFRDDMGIHLTEGPGTFSWENV